MARFFFQLRDRSTQLLDPEGQELSDIEAAKKVALAAARDTLSSDIKQGSIDLGYRIDVEDGGGRLLYSLPMGESFAVVAQPN